MKLENTLQYVEKDNVTKFIGEIKNLSNLSDINKILSKINELDIEEKYKIKYTFIVILGKLIKENKYLIFRQKYVILQKISDYDILELKEYLYSQNIINKLLDMIDNKYILDILKEFKNEDNIYIDLLLGGITIEYLKNNKFRLSSIVKYLIQHKEKKIFYFLEIIFSEFDFDFIRNFLESNKYIQLTLNEYYVITKKYLMISFTQEEAIILKKLLIEKIYNSEHPISRDYIIEGRDYHDEYQDKYCKNFIKNGNIFQDELRPLIVTNTEISLPYKKILKFNKNTLYEVPKQIVHTLRISHKNDNLIGGLKSLYNIDEDIYIDMKWYVNNIKYLENLPIKDKMTIMGYTHNGDKYANMFLMGNKESLTSYLKDRLSYQEKSVFFPLYYQAKEKIIREKHDILKYFTGDKKDQKNFIDDFIIPITSNIEEIKAYNLLQANKQLLSIDFWEDVIKLFIKDLDRIIRESPPTESKMILFRGSESKYYKTSSNLYVNNTFMSTSFDYKVSLNFADYNCCLKKIIINPGSRLLFTECLSQYQGENEILIGLNNKFNIIEDKTKYYYNLYKYNQNEEYADNLCIELEKSMDVTVMELIN